MKPWIRFADAPGYEVVTLTTVFDSFGYCRTGNTVAARRPIRRISRLTTTDKTERLMKISVMAIADHPAKYALDRVHLDPSAFRWHGSRGTGPRSVSAASSSAAAS